MAIAPRLDLPSCIMSCAARARRLREAAASDAARFQAGPLRQQSTRRGTPYIHNEVTLRPINSRVHLATVEYLGEYLRQVLNASSHAIGVVLTVVGAITMAVAVAQVRSRRISRRDERCRRRDRRTMHLISCVDLGDISRRIPRRRTMYGGVGAAVRHTWKCRSSARLTRRRRRST